MGQHLLELAFRGAAGAAMINLVLYIASPLPWPKWLIRFAIVNLSVSALQVGFYPDWRLTDFLFISCVVWGFACLVLALTHKAHQLLLTELKQAAKGKAASRDGNTIK